MTFGFSDDKNVVFIVDDCCAATDENEDGRTAPELMSALIVRSGHPNSYSLRGDGGTGLDVSLLAARGFRVDFFDSRGSTSI